MRANRETRWASAQFFNSLAISILVGSAIAPSASSAATPVQVLTGIIVAALFHLLALWVVTGSRN